MFARMAASLIALSTILGGAAGTAGLLGSLSALLIMLGRLTAIGLITITIALVVKKVGAWEKLEDLSLGITDKLGLTNGRVPQTPDPKQGTGTKHGLAPWAEKEFKRLNQIVIDKSLGGKIDTAGASAKAKKIIADARKAFEDLQKGVEDSLNTEDQTRKQDIEKLKAWKDQRTDIVKQAHQEYEGIVETAINNMIAKYNEFRDANSNAFGSLFQGPVLTGESFQLAQEWGVVPDMKVINQDLQGQIKAFGAWKADLRAVGKKGAPKELVQELLELGPEAAVEAEERSD